VSLPTGPSASRRGRAAEKDLAVAAADGSDRDDPYPGGGAVLVLAGRESHHRSDRFLMAAGTAHGSLVSVTAVRGQLAGSIGATGRP
jgi:hypothetical protein